MKTIQLFIHVTGQVEDNQAIEQICINLEKFSLFTENKPFNITPKFESVPFKLTEYETVFVEDITNE